MAGAVPKTPAGPVNPEGINMFSIAHEDGESELATVREAPSATWIVAVDRGARKLEDAIARLEAGANVDDVLDELREAHGLVNGRPVTP
jgi:hypothetical protein